MAAKVHAGDVGTVITVDVIEDISNATVTNLIVKQPDGSTVTWAGSLYGTHSIRYTSEAGDLVAGAYKVQAYVEIPTWQGHGEEFEFTVKKNIGS